MPQVYDQQQQQLLHNSPHRMCAAPYKTMAPLIHLKAICKWPVVSGLLDSENDNWANRHGNQIKQAAWLGPNVVAHPWLQNESQPEFFSWLLRDQNTVAAVATGVATSQNMTAEFLKAAQSSSSVNITNTCKWMRTLHAADEVAHPEALPQRQRTQNQASLPSVSSNSHHSRISSD